MYDDTTYCFGLKDPQRTLGHDMKYVVQEEDSWHDHKEISPAHGKTNICGWCCEGEKRKGSRFVRKVVGSNPFLSTER